MGLHLLERETRIDRPREKVFAFFSDARNLERITPPWLRFRIAAAGPIRMAEGTRIDYRLRLRGVPLRWTSEITAWDPPHRFVDEQRRGPYRRWSHEHLFEEDGGGTLVRDRVRYAVPGGELIRRLFVAPDLERVFDYRERTLVEIFRDEGREES